MMYQGYPHFSEEERLRSLQPLDLAGCCNLKEMPDDDAIVSRVRIQMLEGAALVLGDSSEPPIDLSTGSWLEEPTAEQILGIARRYADSTGIEGQPRSLGVIDIDQWTV